MRNPDLNIIKPMQVVSSGYSLYLFYKDEDNLETALAFIESYQSSQDNENEEEDNKLHFSLGYRRPRESSFEFLGENYSCIELYFENDKQQKETEQELSN